MLISTQLTYKTITIAKKGILLTIIMVDYTIITQRSNSVNNLKIFLCKIIKVFGIFFDNNTLLTFCMINFDYHFLIFAQTKNMAYFNYHAKIQNLVKNRHCIGAEIKEAHGKISPALVLFFDNHPPMPIRQEKWDFYFEFLERNDVEIKF